MIFAFFEAFWWFRGSDRHFIRSQAAGLFPLSMVSPGAHGKE